MTDTSDYPSLPSADDIQDLTETYVKRFMDEFQISASTDAADRIRGMLQGGIYPAPKKIQDDFAALVKREQGDAALQAVAPAPYQNECGISYISLNHPGVTAVAKSLLKTPNKTAQKRLDDLEKCLDKAIEIIGHSDITFLLRRDWHADGAGIEELDHYIWAMHKLRTMVKKLCPKTGKKPNLDELRAFVLNAAICYQDVTGKQYTYDSVTDKSARGKRMPISEGGRFIAVSVEYLNEIKSLYGHKSFYTDSNIATVSRELKKQLLATNR